jgi:hypothetical protein
MLEGTGHRCVTSVAALLQGSLSRASRAAHHRLRRLWPSDMGETETRGGGGFAASRGGRGIYFGRGVCCDVGLLMGCAQASSVHNGFTAV